MGGNQWRRGQGGGALCWLNGILKVASFLSFTALTSNFLDIFWRRWWSTVVESYRELKIVLWASHRTLGSSQGWLELAGKQLQSWHLTAMFCNNYPLVYLILDDFGFDGGSYGMGGAGGYSNLFIGGHGGRRRPLSGEGLLLFFFLPVSSSASFSSLLSATSTSSALAIDRAWRGLICKTSSPCCFT